MKKPTRAPLVKRYSLLLLLLVVLPLAGCQPCQQGQCSIGIDAGPGDGSFVPTALEATADQFLATTSPGSGGGGTGGGGGLPELLLDRDTLSPNSATAFSIKTNQALGLRLQVQRPLGAQTQMFTAVTGGRVLQNFDLPQGLGPLSDPTRINFVSDHVALEVGLLHQRALPTRTKLTAQLSVTAGYDLVQTRTTVRSALLDISNTHYESRTHATLGAGIVWQPQQSPATQVELRGAARILNGGQRVARGEFRIRRIFSVPISSSP